MKNLSKWSTALMITAVLTIGLSACGKTELNDLFDDNSSTSLKHGADDPAGDGSGVEPGDDNGSGVEPGDDNGSGVEPGDDHGTGIEPGDDKGGHDGHHGGGHH